MTDVEALRAGDTAAFATLVREYDPMVRRVVAQYVRPDAVGDAAQETWLAVIRGLSRFEGRSSLATWIVSIAMNRARTYGQREARLVPAGANPVDEGAALGPGGFARERFSWRRFQRARGSWSAPPIDWTEGVDERLLAAELAPRVDALIAQLPERQRLALELRDVEGLTTEEVADCLGVSVGNARVLVHRARSTVRAGLEAYIGATKGVS